MVYSGYTLLDHLIFIIKCSRSINNIPHLLPPWIIRDSQAAHYILLIYELSYLLQLCASGHSNNKGLNAMIPGIWPLWYCYSSSWNMSSRNCNYTQVLALSSDITQGGNQITKQQHFKNLNKRNHIPIPSIQACLLGYLIHWTKF